MRNCCCALIALLLAQANGRIASQEVHPFLSAGATSLLQQENPNAVKINLLIAQLHTAMNSKDWPAAMDLLHQLIALDNSRWEFYQNLGTIQANLAHYEEAAKSFAGGAAAAQKAMANATDPAKLKDNISEMLMAEGDAYNRLSKLDEAMDAYSKAVAVSAHPATARYHACTMLSNNGKVEAAIETCKRATADDPSRWEPYQVLGGVLTSAGKIDDALQTYTKGVAAAKKLLERGPDTGIKAGLAQMLNSEGNLLLQTKRYNEAVDVFSQAAMVSPRPATSYFQLCTALYDLKHTAEALAACDKAAAADPTLTDAYYLKASILFGQGKVEKGVYVAPSGTREALNRYLQYAPSGQYAENVRSMIGKLDAPVEATSTPAKK